MAGTAILMAALIVAAAPAPPSAAASDPASDVAGLEELSRAFRAVYERVAPAVVQVHTVGTPHLELPPQHPPVAPFDGDVSGLGSGTVVRADGYILSNFHVIRGADSIRVTFADQRSASARVVGADSLIDIAVLKVDLEDLPAVALAEPGDLRIGDWVLAIGFPLGLGTTLTHGIVSALGRQVNVIESVYGIESFIQTNAVINPGNSGGPLLNLKGELVGVNTAISTRTGFYMGYGLAVPVGLVAEAWRDVLEHGRVVRGYLGLSMSAVTDQRMEGDPPATAAPRGVVVRPVDEFSPAARSGLQAGDVLLAIEGRRVDRPNQVQTLIYGRDPGEQVHLDLLRDGVEHTLAVTLGEREQDRRLARGRTQLAALGLQVAALTRARARALGFTDRIAADVGLTGEAPGVVIAAVEAGSPAARRGLAVDDIITEVDSTRVETPDDILRSVADLDAGEAALFWLWRPQRGVDVRFLRLDSEDWEAHPEEERQP